MQYPLNDRRADQLYDALCVLSAFFYNGRTVCLSSAVWYAVCNHIIRKAIRVKRHIVSTESCIEAVCPDAMSMLLMDSWKEKRPGQASLLPGSVEKLAGVSGSFGRLLGATYRSETFLEFINTSLSVHKLIASGEERMRVRCDTTGYHKVLHTINFLRLGRLYSRASDETATRGDIHEYDRMIIGMQVFFHNTLHCVSIAARR